MGKSVQEFRDAYDAVINGDDRVELKGKTMHYTSMNGNMFSFVSKDGEVGFRMSKENQQWFKDNHGAGVMYQHNSVMRDYVHLTEESVFDMDVMKDALNKSVEFAETLPVKPTKKKK